MVKDILKYATILVLLCITMACSKDRLTRQESTVGTKKSITVNAMSGRQTRTVYDAVNSRAKWSVGDKIGVVATCEGNFTDGLMQLFTGDQESEAQSATFTGSLTDGGEGDYILYAVFPYQSTKFTTALKYNLPNLQYPSANSWDSQCDIMVGKSNEQTDKASVSEATGAISFNHMMGWAKLSFEGFSSCEGENVVYVRISSGEHDSAIAGEITIDLKEQSLSSASAQDKFIIADYSDKEITLGDLESYITMLPGTYSNIDIAVKTTDHYISLSRTNLTVTAGEINEVTVNLKVGDIISTSQESICGEMPTMSSTTEGTLNVLLLGHSFGLNCTEYVPDLLSAAGVTNVNLCRFHTNDCALEDYWGYVKNGTVSQSYQWRENGTWRSSTNSKVVDKLSDTKWDIIIFQQSTATGRGQNPYGGAADYNTYQPYLSLLMEYAVSSQKSRFDNAPYLVWNMIRSYNSNMNITQDTDYTTMYDAIVSATTNMKEKAGFSHILTPGTAMQTARKSNEFIFNETDTFTDASKYHLLVGDGWHASTGLGQYLEACTWFEQLFVPIYKTASITTVVGNTFLPAGTAKSFDDDVVTAEKAAALQAIAHDTKTNNPFASSNPQ